jgi:hypothetical protein
MKVPREIALTVAVRGVSVARFADDTNFGFGQEGRATIRPFFEAKSPATGTVERGSASGALDLLLMCMEVLQLEPDEVRRIEPDAFSHLGEACARCAIKGSCKLDLASLSQRRNLERDGGFALVWKTDSQPSVSATPNEPLIMTSASRGRMAAD